MVLLLIQNILYENCQNTHILQREDPYSVSIRENMDEENSVQACINFFINSAQFCRAYSPRLWSKTQTFSN